MATDRAYAAAVERAAALLGAASAAASAANDAARNGSANAQGLAEQARAVAAAASQALASIGYGPAGAFGYNPGESEAADDAAYAAGVAERARALAEAGQSRDSDRNSSGGLRGLKGWNSSPNADDAARALKGGASKLGGEPAPEPPEPDAYKGPILTPREVEEGDDPSPASKANETDFDRAGLEAARASRQQALDALNREIAAREALSREIARSLEYGQGVLDRARRRLVQELHPDL